MTDPISIITFNELCQFEGISEQIIIQVVEYGIAEPLEGKDTATSWIFDTKSVYWVKKAIRLHDDLEIDWVAVAMVIDLLQQNENLQNENQSVKQQLGRFYLDE